MKLATFKVGDGPDQVGSVDADVVYPFADDLTMRQVISLGLDEAHALAEHAREGQGLPLRDVSLRAPLRPASVRDFVAFEEHVEGVRRSVDGAEGVPEAWYDAPTFYFTNPHSIIATGDDVPFPSSSVARDFELEVAVIVGADGSSLTIDEASGAVFGYTIMNDWSARDIQRAEMRVGLGPAKGKDFATTLGPWIVTADELADRRDTDGFLELEAIVSVNGTEVGHDVISHMGWTFENLIAYASRDSQVRAGDVLGSGTTGGGGCLAELWGRHGEQVPRPLADGDVVEITVERLGRIRNRVASAPLAPHLPAVRRTGRARR